MDARPHPSPISQRPALSPAAGAQWVHACERCGAEMEERQCKIVCGNCGVFRDCSDP